MTIFDVPVHPMVVHLPVAMSLLLPPLAATAIVAIRKGWMPAHFWALILGLALLGAGSATVAARTGHWEEREVRNVVDRSLIREHEERAEIFIWAFGVLAALSALPLAKPLARHHATLRATVGVGTLVIAGLAAWVGHSGGKLVYHYGAAQAYPLEPQTTPVAARTDHD